MRNRERGTMPGFLRLSVMLLACLCLNGCIGAAAYGVGTVMRQMAVGDAYAKWRPQMPAIAPGSGRIIVYPGGSRSVVYEATNIGTGGEQLFVVDRDVCKVLGHSFVFLDLAAGPHEISAEDVSEPFGYRVGKNKLNLKIVPASLTYIRIDKQSAGTFSPSHYFPGVIAAATAEVELNSLAIDKDDLQCRVNKAEERKPQAPD